MNGDVRNGSLAAIKDDTSLMSAFGGKADMLKARACYENYR